MGTSPQVAAEWAGVLRHVIDTAHLTTGDQLSVLVDDAVRQVGLTADVLMVDLAQQVLTPLRTPPTRQTAVVGTVAGRAFQLGEILPASDERGARLLWVPMLNGTERVGALCVGLDPPGGPTSDPVVDDPDLRRWLWTLSGLVGHVLMTKTAYSDRIRRWRTNRLLTVESELLWQLLPPRTFATERVVVSAILEPPAQVAGDAFDYNVDGHMADLAVFDSVGHDLRSSMTTALAITGVRNARRGGEKGLAEIAARADELILQQGGPLQFATAVLGRLDTITGDLDYLIAGHPPPLLVRGGRVVKELAAPPRLPLGVVVAGAEPAVVAHEQLEPGDRLLLYSDGITEARDSEGRFFGEQRLVEFVEHAAAAELSAPETLRRLAEAVLEHQSGRLQDDATLLLVDWSTEGHLRMLPTFAADRPA